MNNCVFTFEKGLQNMRKISWKYSKPYSLTNANLLLVTGYCVYTKDG